MATEREREPSAGTLLQGIVADFQRMLRDEIALARAEIQEIVQAGQASAPKLAGGGGALAVGGLLLVLAFAEGLAALLGKPRWVGYTLAGLALGGGGYLLLKSGREQLQAAQLVPEQTIQTMQDNVDWLKERAG